MSEDKITDLVVPETNFPTLSPEEQADLLQPQNFHPNLKLAHPLSEEVKQKKCAANNFYCDGIDYGEEVYIIAVCFRWHAVLFENNRKTMESFDPKSETTAKIKTMRRRGTEVNPRHGFSWLVFIPQSNSFAVLHPGVSSQWDAGRMIWLCYNPPGKRGSEAADQYPHTKLFKLTRFEKQTPVAHMVLKADPASEKDFPVFIIPEQEQLNKELKKFYDPVKAEPKLTEEKAPER